MIKNFDDIVYSACHKKSTKIAIAQAADTEVLKAAALATGKGIANFVLVGDRENIITLLTELNEDYKDYTIIQASSYTDCAKKAVASVKSGEADVLMKGLLPTSTFLRPVLNKEVGLLTGRLISQVSVFEWKDRNKLLFITDCAVNVLPNLDQKKEILINGLELMKALEYKKPRIAVLASTEEVKTSMPETIDAAALSKMSDRGEFQDALVDGPLAFDVAVSEEAANTKRVFSNVAGQADMLLVPCLNTGNAIYKALIYIANLSAAGVVVGSEVPIISTSRSDDAKTKLYSIALASLLVKE